jgi:hypothetical protein
MWHSLWREDGSVITVAAWPLQRGPLLFESRGTQENILLSCGCCANLVLSTGNHLHNAKLEAERLMLLVCCWLRWPGDCSWSRLTALLLGRLQGVLALHWSSFDSAWCSLKPDGARELIWLVPTKVFADLLLSLVALRLPERTARAPELHCWNSTCWLKRVVLLTELLI